ncbi:uncharacterized protein LOC124928037 [Impatiens glandulifera]|uniref:uncharacterized protein LOC124928037 n=1 Tax=Impatiens glandulifera TaxID=253017 RepID=UPI001FB174A1|nr:uncharacterized protein LOC124928037 [Impatiens glandulifera]XP_047324520.1 uncharacterized protein LOC124928037 [Impatiens glandulifera]
MSSYPVLGNRPIDQWKVTELKEELKKRKLKANGLKDDLIKRLAEAIEQEVESEEEDTTNGVDGEESNAVGAAEEVLVAVEIPHDASADAVQQDGIHDEKQLDTSADVVRQDEINVEKPEIQFETRIASPSEVHVEAGYTKKVEVVVQDSNPEKDIVGSVIDTENDNLVPEIAAKADSTIKENFSVQEANVESIPMESTVETIDNKNDIIPEIAVSKHESKNECDVKPEEESQDIKVPCDDEGKLDSSQPSNQVSVVSPTLGFTVKSNSVSSDIISTNEKNDLKDNIIADNVKLELDVKPEMVQPSSSDFLSDGGSPHPMDVEKPLEIKITIDEKDEEKATNEEMSTENDADLIASERLNLDRSSGDDSMEDDALDNKQLDSVNAIAETIAGVEKPEASVPMVVEETEVPVGIMKADSSVIKHEIHVEKKDAFSAPSAKRKPDQEGIEGGEGNNSSKRLRRWNTNNLQVERENVNGSSTVPTANAPINIIKNEFSRSDSTASEGTPKDRIVPPSPKAPSISLRIDRFLRPFTLKAVQELLGKTGTVTSFWMDHIKTHCYVTYSSVEEAMETRNAIYNLQWPPNGGRLLVAEFVDPQEVKSRVDAPPKQTSSATPVVSAPPLTAMATTPRQTPKQQQQQQLLPPPPPLAKTLTVVREQLPLPPPPPPPAAKEIVVEQPPPILTLDDLFKKTKATPRIYYLPLSDEQVAAKETTPQNGKKHH